MCNVDTRLVIIMSNQQYCTYLRYIAICLEMGEKWEGMEADIRQAVMNE